MNRMGPSSRILALLFLAWPIMASAQELVIPDVSYPTLPSIAASANGFAPPGWQVEARADGDLNADGAADLAFVLRCRDPANILANDGFGETQFDTNPRILAVAFRAPDGRSYRLALQNQTLIPRREHPNLDDPFGDAIMSVENGTLRLSLFRFASAGGWDAGSNAFVFRWQDGAMRLIGYDYSNVRRNSGDARNLSVNFLTRRARIATGNIERDDEDVRWTRLPRRPLLTIDEVGDGLTFDPEGLVAALP